MSLFPDFMLCQLSLLSLHNETTFSLLVEIPRGIFFTFTQGPSLWSAILCLENLTVDFL